MNCAVRPRVKYQRPCEVDERIADSGHLPIDDRGDSWGGLGREEHVVELVVAVKQRTRLIRRSVDTEPLRDSDRGREARGFRTTRAARANVRSGGGDTRRHGQDPRGRVRANRRHGSRRARRRVPPARGRAVPACVGPLLGHVSQNRRPVDTFHDEERCAEHAGVVTREDGTRDRDRFVLDRVEDLVLAQHVVRAGHVDVTRRPPQDPAVIAPIDRERLARTTPDHRRHRQRCGCPERLVEESLQRLDVHRSGPGLPNAG